MAGKVKLDWNTLGFNYIPTASHIRYSYSGGRWDSGRLHRKHQISMSVAATCLHYGQACFEGLKAFRWPDGKVRIFRPEENSRRMNATADYILKCLSAAVLRHGIAVMDMSHCREAALA